MNTVSFFAGGLKFEMSAESADQLQDQAADMGAAAPVIIESLAAVVAAGLAVDAFKRDNSGTRSERPPVNKGSQPGSSDVPKCDCGIPMTDVRGQVYKAGKNKGQPYPNRFYRSKDCKAECGPIK